jgi:hypothetical protein
MPEIAVEYVILIPLVIMQIFLFPYAVSLMMNSWVDSSRTQALQNAATQVGASIQQLYVSMNHVTITSGLVTTKLGVVPSINGYSYTGSATIASSSGSSKVLNLTLSFVGIRYSVSTVVTLGPNAQWQSTSFMSNSTTASINANKDGSGVIWLSFGA